MPKTKTGLTYFRKGSPEAKARMAQLRKLAMAARSRKKKGRKKNPLDVRTTDEYLDRAMGDIRHAQKLKAPDGRAMRAHVYGKASMMGLAASLDGATAAQRKQGGRYFKAGRRLGQRASRQDVEYHRSLRKGRSGHSKNPAMLVLGNPRGKAKKNPAMLVLGNKGRSKNPGMIHGVPASVFHSAKFQAALAMYKRRHGSMPCRISKARVPDGYPDYLVVYGRTPEVKYDAPSNSNKGKRIHHFGKNRKKDTQPWLAGSPERGPKFLVFIGGKFKAKTDWLYD